MYCPLKGGAGVEVTNGAEVIVSYVARTLDAEADSEFQRHMGNCPQCREAVAAQQAVWSALDAWLPVPVSPDFDRKLFRRIAEEEHSRWWRGLELPHWWWRPAMPVAAACALLIGAFVLQYPAPRIAQEAQVEPKLEIEQVEHALDDMDLLRQLGVETISDKPGPSEKI
jgi:anti-sigma factor RsiW